MAAIFRWLRPLKQCPPFWFHCWRGEGHWTIKERNYYDAACRLAKSAAYVVRTCCRCGTQREESL